MYDPEKKKRLEAIRRRKEQLQRELDESNKKKEAPKDQKRTIEQMAKEALKASKDISISSEQSSIESKKIIESFEKRKKLESLKICSISQFFNNSKPDTYEISTQYHNIRDNEEDENEEDNLEKIQKKQHIPLFLHKAPLIIDNDDKFDFKEKTYGLIPIYSPIAVLVFKFLFNSFRYFLLTCKYP